MMNIKDLDKPVREKNVVKPLDIVLTPSGSVAVVTEVTEDGESSLDFIKGLHKEDDHNAWWEPEELKVLDSLPHIIARNMVHPFESSGGAETVDKYFR